MDEDWDNDTGSAPAPVVKTYNPQNGNQSSNRSSNFDRNRSGGQKADDWGPTDSWNAQPNQQDHFGGRGSNRGDRDNRGGGFGSNERRSDNRSRDRAGDDSSSMNVDRNNVGLVIGRGGSTIKEIEHRYRVRVNIGKCSC